MEDTRRPALTGVVLAGGASRRMGTDKALVRIGDQRLVERVCARLAVACEQMLIVAGHRRLPGLAYHQIGDPREGPLGGIVAGLRVATTPLVAVVACDMPFVDPGVVLRLADLWDGEAAVAPRTGEQLQPLHALYATAAVDRFAALFSAGERSPRAALERLDARQVDWPADAVFARSIDTPADLARLARDQEGT